MLHTARRAVRALATTLRHSPGPFTTTTTTHQSSAARRALSSLPCSTTHINRAVTNTTSSTSTIIPTAQYKLASKSSGPVSFSTRSFSSQARQKVT
jgi:hypothetical protein